MSLFTVLPRLVVSSAREVLDITGEASPGVAHEQYRSGFSFSSHGQLLDEGSSGVEDISSDSEQELPIHSVVKGKTKAKAPTPPPLSQVQTRAKSKKKSILRAEVPPSLSQIKFEARDLNDPPASSQASKRTPRGRKTASPLKGAKEEDPTVLHSISAASMKAKIPRVEARDIQKVINVIDNSPLVSPQLFLIPLSLLVFLL